MTQTQHEFDDSSERKTKVVEKKINVLNNPTITAINGVSSPFKVKSTSVTLFVICCSIMINDPCLVSTTSKAVDSVNVES